MTAESHNLVLNKGSKQQKGSDQQKCLDLHFLCNDVFNVFALRPTSAKIQPLAKCGFYTTLLAISSHVKDIKLNTSRKKSPEEAIVYLD